jgi:ribosomal protein S18 acetylase RimI-like enzyme
MEETKRAKKSSPITLDEPTKHNRESVRLLNSTLLPVRYGPRFYDDMVKNADLNRLAYYNDVLVGSICSRYEKQENGSVKIYIMTMGVLAPYRRLGVASALLEHVLKVARENKQVKQVFLHAWTQNDEGIAFYKKHNFKETEKLVGYYKSLNPPDGVVLALDMEQK